MKNSISFLEIINNHIASGKTRLPVFDHIALAIQKELCKEEPDFKKMEKLVMQCQSLTSTVLKIANSSFYRGLGNVKTVRDAIVRLGINEVASIVILASQQDRFKSDDAVISGFMNQLWRHSKGCAIGARWLAARFNKSSEAGEAFFAGLLHDFGKLFILKVIDDIKKDKTVNVKPTQEFIKEMMDSLHTQHGYLLMQSWNLPERYCVVARDHHMEDFNEKNTLITTVRLVNNACNKLGLGFKKDTSAVLAATPEAHALGLSEIAVAELEIMLEDLSMD